MPEQKELRYFDRDKNFTRGTEYYEEQFASYGGEKAVGESSPPYFYKGITFDEEGDYKWETDDDPPGRIRDLLPDIRIILSLRNPISRAYSQYWKNVRQGRERLFPFKAAIKSELEGERNPKNSPLCWVYKNKYSIHIGRWFSLFDRNQIKIIVFEDWVNNVNDTLDEIARFLNIDSSYEFQYTEQRKNVSNVPRSLTINRIYHDHLKGNIFGEIINRINMRHGKPPMDEGTSSFVSEVFESDVRKLENMIDKDLGVWLED